MTAIRHLSDFDPSQLSAQQRRCLRIVKKGDCFRRPGGFGRPPHGVSLDVAQSMIGLGLIKQDYTPRHPTLVLTGAGATVHAVLEQRAARRKH